MSNAVVEQSQAVDTIKSNHGGARPGAGRKPKVQIVQDDPCLNEVEKFISDNLMDIAIAMVERAKKGDNVAAKYLIDRKLGRPAKLTIEDFIECQEYLEDAFDEITEEISEDEAVDETDTEPLTTENSRSQTQNTKLAQTEFLRRMRANNRRRKMARRK